MIKVEGLTKDYGMRRAIDSLTFHAEKGEILGFLGPNGAGKTTAMRILCGYMPPTSGLAQVAGYDVVDQSLEVRKRVGYLPETVPLYTDMPVFDYLKFMADLRHLKDAEDRVDEVLEIVHMSDRSESMISSLSKGMRQRIGIAQAIIHKPEVLILDEPTIGLDPAQIVDVRSIIRELGKERTILLSTHILSEAQQVCDRVLIINKGKIVAEDTPERLQERLTGSGRIFLKIRGDEDGIEGLVKKVAGVVNVSPEGEGSYEVATVAGQDLRPDIARVVVKEGFDLLEIRLVGMSLEDIFMQLTRDEPQPPAVTDEGLAGESEQGTSERA
jgi:ABC-2 type transport system ATP-binding protein